MSVALRVYESVKRFWIRRKYQRLALNPDASARRRTFRLSRLGGRRRWRLWKIQAVMIPKVQRKLNSLSPNRVLACLRDFYIDGMVRISDHSGGLHNDSLGFCRSKSVSASRRAAFAFDGDVEKRVLYEICTSLVASHPLNY